MTQISSKNIFVLEVGQQEIVYDYLQKIGRRFHDGNDVLPIKKNASRYVPEELSDNDLRSTKWRGKNIGIPLTLKNATSSNIIAREKELLKYVYQLLLQRDTNRDGNIDKEFQNQDLIINFEDKTEQSSQPQVQGLSSKELKALEILERYKYSVFQITVQNDGDGSLGTGSIYYKKYDEKKGVFVYRIVTNAHVVDSHWESQLSLQESTELTITLTTYGDTLNFDNNNNVQIVGTDPYIDIAVVQFETASDLEVIEFGTNADVSTFTDVFIWGNSLGLGLRPNIGQVLDPNYFIHGNLGLFRISPIGTNGNSGGPLFDLDGKQIGVVVKVFELDEIHKTPFQDLLVLPIDDVRHSVAMIESGKVQHGYWGLHVSLLSPELRNSLLPEEWNHTGLQITRVFKNSPANSAGLQEGDIILAVDGDAAITSLAPVHPVPTKFYDVMRKKKSGEVTKLTVYRPHDKDGQLLEIEITAQFKEYKRSETIFSEIGLSIQNLSEDNKAYFNLPPETEGVVIVKDTGKQSANLTNMIVFEVDKKPIKNIQEFQDRVSELKKAGHTGVTLTLLRTPPLNYTPTNGGVGAQEYFYVPF